MEATGVRDPGACSALSTSHTFSVSYSVATPTTFHFHFTSKWGGLQPSLPWADPGLWGTSRAWQMASTRRYLWWSECPGTPPSGALPHQCLVHVLGGMKPQHISWFCETLGFNPTQTGEIDLVTSVPRTKSGCPRCQGQLGLPAPPEGPTTASWPPLGWESTEACSPLLHSPSGHRCPVQAPKQYSLSKWRGAGGDLRLPRNFFFFRDRTGRAW